MGRGDARCVGPACAAARPRTVMPGAPARSRTAARGVYSGPGVTEAARSRAERRGKGRRPTLSTQESKNSRAACRAEPKEHSSMNCENICVRSSCEYSLWLERSRDLRKPGGAGRGRGGCQASLPQRLPPEPLPWPRPRGIPAVTAIISWALLAQPAHPPGRRLSPQRQGPMESRSSVPTLSDRASPRPLSPKRPLPMGVAHHRHPCAQPKPRVPGGLDHGHVVFVPSSFQAQKGVWRRAGAHECVCPAKDQATGWAQSPGPALPRDRPRAETSSLYPAGRRGCPRPERPQKGPW